MLSLRCYFQHVARSGSLSSDLGLLLVASLGHEGCDQRLRDQNLVSVEQLRAVSCAGTGRVATTPD